MNIVILGPQGSGKSTQARLIAQKLNLPLLDVGDFLRLKAQEPTDLGRKVKESVERGMLLDDATLIGLASEELKNPKYREGAVIDGAPRTLNQAKLMDSIVGINKVFYLSVPDEVNIERLLKRGRKDDTPKLIKKRLTLYHENTQPALSYYREKGLLYQVDGTGSSEDVFRNILRELREK